MKRTRGPGLSLALLGLLSASWPETSAASAEENGVLLELFTSEGCSSCPPADRQLAQLAAAGAQNGVPLIALEWHVDYWNYLGWSDPFSAASHTRRQQGYAQALAAGRVYTPQLVIDGRFELIGSNEQQTRALIAQAGQNANQKARLGLTLEGEQLRIAIETSPAELSGSELWLALTESELVTAVLRGENAGQRLRHGPVVRRMSKLATVQKLPFQLTVPLGMSAGQSWRRQNLRAVVILQRTEPGLARVLGAAQLALSPTK